jgi:hypothetical protein
MSATPTPYTPPAELLERAAKELEHAHANELERAALLYESYNKAVGGRSAATGAPLPSWEGNPNALVKHGWLEAAKALRAKVLAEVVNAVGGAGLASAGTIVQLLANAGLLEHVAAGESWGEASAEDHVRGEAFAFAPFRFSRDEAKPSVGIIEGELPVCVMTEPEAREGIAMSAEDARALGVELIDAARFHEYEKRRKAGGRLPPHEAKK